MTTTYLLFGLLILLFLIGSVYFLIRKKREKNTPLEIHTELKENENILPSPIPEEDIVVQQEESKPLIIEQKRLENYESSIKISLKTEQKIVKQLVEFENKKDFLKKEISLNYLSEKFGTNTKYLSEVIRTQRQQSFNNYLNGLRINYLLNEFNLKPALRTKKISEIADKIGFASHSAFSTIFTQMVGESPSSYIKKLKQE